MSVGVFLSLDVLRAFQLIWVIFLGCQNCLGVFEGVFGDSLHEGFAQTGANSSFWPNRQNGTVGECVPKGGRSIGRQAVMLIGLGIFLSSQQVLVSFQKICDIPWSTNAPSGSRDTNTESDISVLVSN